MNYTFYETAMLFFTYSFLAWLAETAVATIKEKDFRNRGLAWQKSPFLVRWQEFAAAFLYDMPFRVKCDD